MIGKRKKEVTSDFENVEEQSNKRNKKNRSPDLGNTKETTVSKFSSPTFNIHIHVPPYNMSSPKIYLPRVQPVIHLHFDEIARKLDVNQNEKGEKFLGKVFETLLPMATPKFGKVKFHFNSKSGGTDLEKSNETPCSTRTQINDSQLNKGKGKEKSKPNAIKRSKLFCEQKDNECISKENSENNSDEKLLSKYKDLNLKNPVVLLTDICKSKTWTGIVAPAVNNSNESENKTISAENEIQNNSDVEHNTILIKEEKECDTPPPSSPTFNKSYVSDDTLENGCGNVKVEEILLNKSTIQDMVANNKSLTALFEGCNFSEILNRFRTKCIHYIADNVKNPDESNVNCNSNVNEDFTDIDLEENNCNSHSGIKERESGSDKNVCNHNKSPFQAGEYSFNVNEENFVRESDAETVDFEFSPMRCETEMKSDTLSFTLENPSVKPEVFVDSETLEFTSSIKKSSDCEGNREASKMQKTSSFDIGNLDLHLHLIQKEMKRRSQVSSTTMSHKNKVSEPRKKLNPESVKSNKSTPQKRPKPSPEKKSFKSSSSLAEDYIPLNASGPTKFAVAPLDNIHPYKTHSAKSFKEKMLFGNRVARFSSSDKLKIYQMKQAARKAGAIAAKNKTV